MSVVVPSFLPFNDDVRQTTPAAESRQDLLLLPHDHDHDHDGVSPLFLSASNDLPLKVPLSCVQFDSSTYPSIPVLIDQPLFSVSLGRAVFQGEEAVPKNRRHHQDHHQDQDPICQGM